MFSELYRAASHARDVVERTKIKNQGSGVWLPALPVPGYMTLANNIILNFLICQMVITIPSSQDYSENKMS